MKTATKRAQSYELCCPHCGRTHESDNSTVFWTLTEIELSQNQVQTCWICHEAFKLPKV